MTPFGKRSTARRHLRLAQNAWASGQRDKALRSAEMAVHFDPLSREAIQLRSDIWLGRSCVRPTVGMLPADASPASPMDGDAIDGWLLDEMERAPARLHPLDPGQPGPRKDITRPRTLQ